MINEGEHLLQEILLMELSQNFRSALIHGDLFGPAAMAVRLNEVASGDVQLLGVIVERILVHLSDPYMPTDQKWYCLNYDGLDEVIGRPLRVRGRESEEEWSEKMGEWKRELKDNFRAKYERGENPKDERMIPMSIQKRAVSYVTRLITTRGQVDY